MFDLFGLRARREIALLNAAINEAELVIKQKAVGVHILRNVAESLKARVRTHGMTDAEKLFMDECRDIFKNGKMISGHKFNLRLSEITRVREEMK